eukprot:scaffold5198_cov247-Pinguiococcus_pyrenoidosus.AAC.9
MAASKPCSRLYGGGVPAKSPVTVVRAARCARQAHISAVAFDVCCVSASTTKWEDQKSCADAAVVAKFRQ